MTRRNYSLVPAAAALLLGLTFGLQAGTQADSSHPDYVSAFGNLRDARSCLTVNKTVKVTSWEKVATFNIDKAMYEVRQAGKYDGINIPDSPAVNQGNLKQGRLAKALSLVQSAESTLGTNDGNSKAQGWNQHAVYHIKSSIKMLNQAMANYNSKG